MKEHGINVYYTDGEMKHYGGVTYHKFYGETLRLYRNNQHDVFIPIRNVRMLVYTEY